MQMEPAKLVQLQQDYMQQLSQLWRDFFERPEQMAQPLRDNRFADAAWQKNPLAAFYARTYLLNSDFMSRLADTVESDKKTKKRIKFAVSQFVDAASPSNYLALNPKAQPAQRIVPGAVIRVARLPKDGWEIVQLPQVEALFVAANAADGAVRALVGGFDFNLNKFNHVTQGWRQPGSSFKPFIYSAALEQGFTPSTVVNDAPIYVDPAQTGGQLWEPKNFEGKNEGPMRLRQALAKSKNLVSIRVLQTIGPASAQQWATRFGFDADKHPPYLTLALGAGSVTAWQMLAGYNVFANGGHRVTPYLIARVTDANGKVLMEAPAPAPLDEANRAIPARNAWLTDNLLRDVTRYGTAARAGATLKRADLAGKTGTTNDSHDAWFAGYGGGIVGVAWMGFDQPRPLGTRETGGGLALPIWIGYMQTALKGRPEEAHPMPEGLVVVGSETYFEEFPPGSGIASVGLTEQEPPAATDATAPAEKKPEPASKQIF